MDKLYLEITFLNSQSYRLFHFHTLYTEVAFGDIYETKEQRMNKKHVLSEDLVEELLVQRARGWADKSE